MIPQGAIDEALDHLMTEKNSAVVSIFSSAISYQPSAVSFSRCMVEVLDPPLTLTTH